MITSRTIVLDTSVLAELMRPQPDPAVMRWTNAQPIGTLAVTAVSLAELLHGMRRMSDLSRRIALREALDEFVHDDLAKRVLPFDDLAADYYADFVWKHEQAGTTISMADAQIAATCRSHGVTLATKDPAPYADLGVRTVDPWTAPLPPKEQEPVLPPPELDRHGNPIPPRRPGVARGGVGPSRPPRTRRPRRTPGTGPRTTPAKKPAKKASAPTPGRAAPAGGARSGTPRAGAPQAGPASRGASPGGAAAGRNAAAGTVRASSARTGSAGARATRKPSGGGDRAAGAAPPSGGSPPPTKPQVAMLDDAALQRWRRGAERLRRHVTQVQDATAARTAAARDAAARPAAGRRKPAPSTSSNGPAGAPGRRGARLLGPLVDADGREVERSADGRLRPRGERPPGAAAKPGPTPGASGPKPAPPKPPSAPDDAT